MTFQNDSTSISTSSTGTVALTTATACAVLGLASFCNPWLSVNVEAFKTHFNTPHYESHLKHWESRLSGADSSGGESYLNSDQENFITLNSFAMNLISEISDPPKEFEETFKKIFWDILA